MNSSNTKKTSLISAIIYMTSILVSILSLFCILYVLDQEDVGIWTSVNTIIFWATAFDLGVRSTLQHRLLTGSSDQFDAHEKADITFTLSFFVLKNLILVLVPTIILMLSSNSESLRELAPSILSFSLAASLTHSIAIIVEIGRARNKLFFVYYWSLGLSSIQLLMALTFVFLDLSFKQFLSNYTIAYIVFFLVNIAIFHANFYEKIANRKPILLSLQSLINPNYLIYSLGHMMMESGPILLLAFTGNIPAVGLLAPWYRGFYLTSGFFKYVVLNVFLSRAPAIKKLINDHLNELFLGGSIHRALRLLFSLFTVTMIISICWVASFDYILSSLFGKKYNISNAYKGAFLCFCWLAMLEAFFQGTCVSQKMDVILRRSYGAAGLFLLIFYLCLPLDSVSSVLLAHLVSLCILVLVMGAGLWKRK